MTTHIRCDHCDNEFLITASPCPHCAGRGHFPNVALADTDVEKKELARRYREAVDDAGQRGCADRLRAFETEAGRSEAVIARSLHETQRLANQDNEVYATYHQLTEIEFRIPDGDSWDVLRKVTDSALFGNYMKHIRFAALSLDGLGLMSYGEYAWVLRENMIAHRASVFEENSVMFMDRMDIRVADVDQLPKGHRATWQDRSKLCVAKLAAMIDSDTPAEAFPKLLLRQGSNSEEDDEFVEVHIGGPITVRTIERIIPRRGPRRKIFDKALREKLERYGVKIESNA